MKNEAGLVQVNRRREWRPPGLTEVLNYLESLTELQIVNVGKTKHR